MIILTFETALPVAIFSFIKIAWNLPRLTITLLSLKQFIHIHFQILKCLQDYLRSWQSLTRYYHWRNYEQTHYTGKRKNY